MICKCSRGIGGYVGLMLETEQEKTKLLMLAAPPAEPEPAKKKNCQYWDTSD